ncbi:PREDICTED: luciferin 4-monooxygenase-like [Nicrophorus vespilloides]|uniref:Luciferin 4-monooxygenase-like n=1 Tax=Nicrophorus vespilloides TaxID=110193 RepID=A0ABM1MMH9_NICVS|nr:PREDICTED: luciferin 4-monooxygenase-like [Nicrophorus vespilloides]
MQKNFIKEGPQFVMDFPEAGLGMRYFNRMDSFKDKINQVDSTTGLTETTNRVKIRAIQVASELLKCGVTENDVILLSCRPRSDEAVIILATLFVGAQLAPLDPDLDYEEYAPLLKKLSPRVIFCDPRVVVNVERSMGEGHNIIYTFGNDGHKRKFPHIFKTPVDTKFVPATIKNPKTKTAFITLTEGVVHLPKLVMLSHYGALARATMMNYLIFNKSQRVISYFPLVGTSQIILTLITFERPLVKVIPRAFVERDVCRIIHDMKIEFAILGTSNAVKIARYHSKEQDYNLSCLKQILVGGIPASARTIAYIMSVMRNVIVANIYGVAECGFIAGVTPEDTTLAYEKPASCGKLFPGSVVKIVDWNSNEPLGPDTWGELCYKGPDLAIGYFQDNVETFTYDGFFKTGDVAQYDEQGCLYIQGRLDDVLAKDETVFSAVDIEDICMMHSKVNDAVVLTNGTIIVLYCVVDDPKLTTKDLFGHLQEILPASKLPHKVIIVNELPKTKNGKIKKYILQRSNTKKSIQIF